VAHPFAGNDIYVYYGQEQTQANAWTVGGVAGQGRAQVRYASAQPYAAASGVVCMVA
jgi:hypothetical protein